MSEVCSAPRRKAIFDLVDHLEGVEKIFALTRLLAFETAASPFTRVPFLVKQM